MALPSRVLNSGVTSLSTVAICGEGASDVRGLPLAADGAHTGGTFWRAS